MSVVQLNTREGVKEYRVVSSAEWLAAREELLKAEKEETRMRDAVNARRRELPWERVEKDYVFDNGERLADLFNGRSQLIVYHFMFGPESEPCPSCSWFADTFNGLDVHLLQRDISFLCISRAPQHKIDAYKKRLGWSFKWISSSTNTFNIDYFASFPPEQLSAGTAFFNYKKQSAYGSEVSGISVFAKDADGDVYHTYSAFQRGVDALNAAYQLIDLTPKGRDEERVGNPQAWVRPHDSYAKQDGHECNCP